MEPKKIKKLVLKKEIISNLTENSMSYVKGGNGTDGSGYGPCACNPTDLCDPSNYTCGGCVVAPASFSCPGAYCC